MSQIRMPRPMVREDFRKRLRADLVNEAVVLAEERRLRRASFSERVIGLLSMRMRAIAVAAAILVMLIGGAGTAAAGSLPGDLTYGLKRAAEAIELALAPTAEAKVQVLAAQSERRLEELKQSQARPDKAPTASSEYEAAVQRFADAVEALRSADPGTKHDVVEQVVDAARDKHVPVLEDLEQRVPERARPAIERAIEQHDKLAAPSGEKERGAKPSERPGNAPRSGDERPSPTPVRELASPRATETPRGGRPTSLPNAPTRNPDQGRP